MQVIYASFVLLQIPNAVSQVFHRELVGGDATFIAIGIFIPLALMRGKWTGKAAVPPSKEAQASRLSFLLGILMAAFLCTILVSQVMDTLHLAYPRGNIYDLLSIGSAAASLTCGAGLCTLIIQLATRNRITGSRES